MRSWPVHDREHLHERGLGASRRRHPDGAALRRIDAQLLDELPRRRGKPARRSSRSSGGASRSSPSSDTSPVTEADRAAELIILGALARAAPGVPVIAEEEVAAGRIPAHGDTYFLVDPLDGTKEFIRGGDDYTVNIGLIESGVPKLGVVFSPARARCTAGCVGQGAWLEDGRRPAARSQPGSAAKSWPRSRPSRTSTRTPPTISRLRSACCDHVALARGSNSASSPKVARTSIRGCRRPANGTPPRATQCCSPRAAGSTGRTEALRYGKRAFLNRAFVATAGWAAAQRSRHSWNLSPAAANYRLASNRNSDRRQDASLVHFGSSSLRG